MWKKIFVTTIFNALAMFQTCSEQGPAVVCTPVKQYSAATLDKAADEYAQIKKEFPTTTQLIADYRSMRAAARACAQGKAS